MSRDTCAKGTAQIRHTYIKLNEKCELHRGWPDISPRGKKIQNRVHHRWNGTRPACKSQLARRKFTACRENGNLVVQTRFQGKQANRSLSIRTNVEEDR